MVNLPHSKIIELFYRLIVMHPVNMRPQATILGADGSRATRPRTGISSRRTPLHDRGGVVMAAADTRPDVARAKETAARRLQSLFTTLRARTRK